MNAKPTIFAIHGMWATSKRWDNFKRFFEKKGFRFFAPSLPYHYEGNEHLGSVLGGASIRFYVANVLRRVRRVKKIFPGPIVLIGHSMGGLIAQKVAEMEDVSALVLINSAPPRGVSLHTDPRYKRDIARYFLKILFSRPFKPSYELACRYIMNNMPPQDWPQLYEGFVYESGRAAREILFGKIVVDETKVECPVRVVAGMKDMIIRPRVSFDLAEKYGTHSFCDLHPTDRGHWPQTEPGWEEEAESLRFWLINCD